MFVAQLLASGLLLAAGAVNAQSSTSAPSSQSSQPSSSGSSESSRSSTRSGTSSSSAAPGFTFASSLSISTITSGSVSAPTGPYQSLTQQITVSSTSGAASNGSRNGTSSTSSNTLFLSGTGSPNSTATATRTSAAPPRNTQSCNNYPELCSKKYMNFTEVAAHNSFFHIPNNAASNQMYPVLSQLNDGVRMIQGQTHWYNNSLYACHSSCDLLNAGPLVDQLTPLREWVQQNPYEVVTILLGNDNFRNVSDYVKPIQDSGLMPYLYVPPKIPMLRDDWPTLSNMILSGKRVVLFLDYQANQTEVPYVLDEFSQMWETPFSPTDMNFPCTQQRPPGLNRQQQDQRAYIANHNLNVQLSFAGVNLLIPNFPSLDQVNSVNGTAGQNNTGSLGEMARDCRSDWNVPPSWLLVDFYNYGNYNGSVFEVAAEMNGLNYTRRSSCCGQNQGLSAAASLRPSVGLTALVALVVVMGGFFLQ